MMTDTATRERLERLAADDPDAARELIRVEERAGAPPIKGYGWAVQIMLYVMRIVLDAEDHEDPVADWMQTHDALHEVRNILAQMAKQSGRSLVLVYGDRILARSSKRLRVGGSLPTPLKVGAPMKMLPGYGGVRWPMRPASIVAFTGRVALIASQKKPRRKT